MLHLTSTAKTHYTINQLTHEVFYSRKAHEESRSFSTSVRNQSGAIEKIFLAIYHEVISLELSAKMLIPSSRECEPSFLAIRHCKSGSDPFKPLLPFTGDLGEMLLFFILTTSMDLVCHEG